MIDRSGFVEDVELGTAHQERKGTVWVLGLDALESLAWVPQEGYHVLKTRQPVWRDRRLLSSPPFGGP